MPSSRFLTKQMLKNIDFNKARVLVEFGPGNGIITKHILNKMHKNAVLICFEINEEFFNQLQKIDDNRLIITNQSAENIELFLKAKKLQSVDCFISSLPLSIIPKDLSINILQKSKKVLTKNGIFIQYQYSLYFHKIFKQIFGKNNVLLGFELLNIPPAFIYRCKN